MRERVPAVLRVCMQFPPEFEVKVEEVTLREKEELVEFNRMREGAEFEEKVQEVKEEDVPTLIMVKILPEEPTVFEENVEEETVRVTLVRGTNQPKGEVPVI